MNHLFNLEIITKRSSSTDEPRLVRLGEPRRLVVAVEAHVATGRDAIDNFLDSRGRLIAENFDTVLVVVPGVAVELEERSPLQRRVSCARRSAVRRLGIEPSRHE